MELTRKKCRYGCSINQVALFSTHGALYGNIPEGRWAEPQLQPPKRSQFMACSFSQLFLLQPLSRAASSLSLLNRGLVKQKNTGSSCMAVPLLTPRALYIFIQLAPWFRRSLYLPVCRLECTPRGAILCDYSFGRD